MWTCEMLKLQVLNCQYLLLFYFYLRVNLRSFGLVFVRQNNTLDEKAVVGIKRF